LVYIGLRRWECSWFFACDDVWLNVGHCIHTSLLVFNVGLRVQSAVHDSRVMAAEGLGRGTESGVLAYNCPMNYTLLKSLLAKNFL
jgi:hypothetical protein